MRLLEAQQDFAASLMFLSTKGRRPLVDQPDLAPAKTMAMIHFQFQQRKKKIMLTFFNQYLDIDSVIDRYQLNLNTMANLYCDVLS